MQPRVLLIPIIYLKRTSRYLNRDLDHDQDGMNTEVPKTFNFIFPREDGKYSEMEFAAKPNISNADYKE